MNGWAFPCWHWLSYTINGTRHGAKASAKAGYPRTGLFRAYLPACFCSLYWARCSAAWCFLGMFWAFGRCAWDRIWPQLLICRVHSGASC